MLCTKSTLAGFVALGCVCVAGPFLLAQNECKAGRVLSQGQMTAVFGDLVDHCKFPCTCAARLTCDAGCCKCGGSSSNQTWWHCIYNGPKSGTECSEDGEQPCKNFPLLAVGGTSQTSNCNQCVGGVNAVWVNQGVNCGSQDAIGDGCGEGKSSK
jgi:hypothetical protein